MKPLLFGLFLSLITIGILACGGTSSGSQVPPVNEEKTAVLDSVDSTPAVIPTSSSMDSTQGAQEGSKSPKEGGTFRRLWADPPTLDPHLTTDTTSAGIVVEIFSGLVGISTSLELVPDLAESWEIDESGRVYTFFIRPDAKFHDGKQVTAQDFKWSIERAANPKTGSPVADVYLNDIVGFDDVFEGRTMDMEGVEVIDRLTLKITIDAAKAYFLAKLTYPTAYVLDRNNVESGGSSWTDRPNGTGPFKLIEYKIGERIVLERNDNYHREKPKINNVVMNLAGGQSMAMYENDEIDITGVGLFDLDRVLDPNEPLNKELIVAGPAFSISYIGFNTSTPPFDDPKFRRALNHAIDKELIAKEVLSDLVVPAYGILPPGFPGYNNKLKGLEYDPGLALKLLNESKYADPDNRPRIVVTVPGTGGTVGLDLEVIIEMWNRVLGVQVEIQQVEWATYLQDLNAKKFQAFAGLGWEADYPDPQDFLDVLFHTESSVNHGNYSNLEVDKLLEKARLEQDISKRIDLYNQAEALIIKDAAWVPLWYGGDRYVLVKSHVEDYRVTPMIIPKLRHISFR